MNSVRPESDTFDQADVTHKSHSVSFAQLGLMELKFQHGTGSGKKQSVWNKNEQNFAIRGCFQVILRIYF